MIKRMSLENIQGKLSRTEMKNIMAGSGSCYACFSSSNGNAPHYSCWYSNSPSSLCQRVYGSGGYNAGPVACGGCTMN